MPLNVPCNMHSLICHIEELVLPYNVNEEETTMEINLQSVIVIGICASLMTVLNNLSNHFVVCIL